MKTRDTPVIPAEPFVTMGEELDTRIPVRISYRIIELFSARLYSSVNKAIEEFVSNSYDGNASRVDLLSEALSCASRVDLLSEALS